jgi:hypothetical protein
MIIIVSVPQSAIMAVADIVEGFGDDILPHLDVGGVGNPAGSLLYQLLLKGSSNDKRFVIEEAKRALTLTADYVGPVSLLDLLLPYAAHKSPKVCQFLRWGLGMCWGCASSRKCQCFYVCWGGGVQELL